jgi:hypothetical protein
MFIEQWDSAIHPAMLRELQLEVDNITRNNAWKKTFERAGSYMLESNDITSLPTLRNLYNFVSDPVFLRDLESKLKVTGIICDPHMVGAGYSQIKDYGDLKPHIDFNWNDRIKMYRVASLIIYLSTPEEGGEIEFEGVDKIAVKANRAVLFEHSETVRHFVHPVKGIRNAVRFFYYASKQEAPAGYHRSLYGLKNGKPTDTLE